MIRKLVFLCLMLSTSIAFGTEKHFNVIHIADLVALMKSSSPSLYIYDVNVESTRKHVGIIPGAKLLSSSAGFDPIKELPKDKSARLVFYCANTQCTASHAAAERAGQLGYKNVDVMVDGIYGWKKAGQPTETLSKTAQVVAPKTADELVKLNSAVIVDVREAEERHDIVRNARWVPMSLAADAKAWSGFSSKLPKEKTIIFHCAVGMRAKRAAEKLAADGFKTAYFQGPDQWRAAGLRLEKGPAQ
jgi:rhodanese-related sulfurtransferase